MAVPARARPIVLVISWADGVTRRTALSGRVTVVTSARPSSSVCRGSRPWACGAAGSIGGSSASRLHRCESRLEPDTPSTVAWCIFMKTTTLSVVVPLDHPHLPQRPRPVQRQAGEVAGELGELGGAARRRQREPVDVAVDVEVPVVHPDRVVEPERHLAQPPGELGDVADPAVDLRAERLEGVAVRHGAGSSTITPHTCISCAGVSRYRKLASSPDNRSMCAPSDSQNVTRSTSQRRPRCAATGDGRLMPGAGARQPRSTFVPMSFLRRQLVTAALTANAIRPVPGFRAGIPAFAAGWLTTELAEHLMALTAPDAAAHVVRRAAGAAGSGLALAAANLAGQAFLLDQARRVRTNAEDALVRGARPRLRRAARRQADAGRPRDAVAQAGQPVPDARRRGRVEKNIPYAPEHGKRGLLDIYLPAEGDRLEGAGAAPGARRRAGRSATRTSRASR